MTIHSLVKYLALIACGQYVAAKSLGKRISTKIVDIIRLIVFAVMCSVMMCLSSEYLPEVRIILLVCGSLIFNEAYFSESRERVLKATLFSYTVTYAGSFLVLLLYSSVVISISNSLASIELLTAVAVGLLQLVLAVVLFRIKRISRGLVSFFDSYHGDYILCFSAIVLFIISLWTPGENSVYFTAVIVSSVILSAVLIFFWTRARIKKNYLERVARQKYDKLEEVSAAQKAEIESLSAIIHKDNKLVPSLATISEDFARRISEQEDASERAAMAEDFIAQLRSIAAERRGAITDYEQTGDPIDRTGVVVIDSVMLHMARKAAASEISFDFKCSCDIEKLLSSVSKSDVSTLLADLTENAIIAVRHSSDQPRSVSVEIGCREEVFYIAVSDSGVPFPRQVLEKLGQQRITTHGDDGGSGIGMMTTCELCRKYSASLRIEPATDGDYTKCISVVFDGASRMPLSD